jgi:hypothetical protein
MATMKNTAIDIPLALTIVQPAIRAKGSSSQRGIIHTVNAQTVRVIIVRSRILPMTVAPTFSEQSRQVSLGGVYLKVGRPFVMSLIDRYFSSKGQIPVSLNGGIECEEAVLLTFAAGFQKGSLRLNPYVNSLHSPAQPLAHPFLISLTQMFTFNLSSLL